MHLTVIDGKGALEHGRVECGGMHRDTETMLLKGAMSIRCSNARVAREIIRRVDKAPALEGRRVRAMKSDYGILSAQQWKQEKFPIGTTKLPEMLVNCPEDINDVDTGIMRFGLECMCHGMHNCVD